MEKTAAYFTCSWLTSGFFLFDSVNGDGSTVKALSEAIYGQIIQLPMMSELIPALWANVRKIVQQSYTEHVGPLANRLVLGREEAVKLLRQAVSGLPDESLWEALAFWGTLGDVVVSRDVLVTDIQTLIELMRPILHHAPMESLKRMAKSGRDATGKGEKIQCDEVLVPDFAKHKKAKQDDIKKLIKKLAEERILCFAALEHMSCWKDLSVEERSNTTKVLEACQLIVREHDGETAGSVARGSDNPTEKSWLVACRLDKATPKESKGASELTNSKAELGFQASARYVPSGFFSTLQASQLMHTAQSWLLTSSIEQVDSSNLKMRFKTLFGKGWETVSVSLTKCNKDDDDDESMAVEVWSTSLAMLKYISSNMDKIRQDKFPGMVFQHVVWFLNSEFSEEVLEWQLERSNGSLTTILEQRQMALEITATEWTTKKIIKGMVVQDAIKAVQTRAAFFLSHAWGDWSVREQAKITVTDGLQRAVEKWSGELVWVDSAEMKGGTQFHTLMEQGVSHAQCIIICLSYVYLTRRNCLQELCWAVQGYASEGKPLIVVSVDSELTFDAINQWDASQNLTICTKDNWDKEVKVTVDRRTLAFAQKWLVRVMIYKQWSLGEGALSKERLDAVEEMLKSVRVLQREKKSPNRELAPSLEVVKERDSWFVLEAESP